MTKLRTSLTRALGGQASESLRTSFVASTSGTLLLSVGATVWAFATVLLLTRALGGRGYGVYAYALAWSTILAVPAGLGLSQLVVREIAGYEARRRPGSIKGLLQRSYVAVMAASGVVTILAALFGLLAIGDGRDIRLTFLVGLLLVPIVSVYRLGEGVMRGFRRVVEGRVSETTIQPLLLIGFVTAAALITDGHVTPVAAMALTVVSAAAAAVVSQWLVHRTVPASVRDADPSYHTADWGRTARPLLLLQGGQALHAQIGTILLGALATVTDTGAFSVALRCAMFVGFLQFVVNFPLAPSISRLRANDDRARLQRLVGSAAMAATAVAAPVALGLVLLREPVLRVFDPAFATGATALVILVVGEMVNVGTGSVGISLTMTGHERLVAVAVTTAVAANALIGVALIPRFGLEGAAVARTLSIAGLNIGLAWQLWRRERIWAPVVGRRLTTGSRVSAAGRVRTSEPGTNARESSVEGP